MWAIDVLLTNLYLLHMILPFPDIRPHRLSVRTPGFHPGKGGSTPPGVTTKKRIVTFSLPVTLMRFFVWFKKVLFFEINLYLS